ncbi:MULTISPECIES: 3-hydroxyacyl-CoA dehydrogenase NAD-binding domain-containing protein [unclassified Chelatococcus]|uniref:3-hydroxyacyl-CoA dehydrogenase NAD-binding domain-containing protein n=1 Tax=unclassified Chelatococcus TaxID=2638111 RepID=UPI001BCD2073|nr:MULTISPECIES: 3-hydroxyacyl-CoA dehydrogenase NAD-binding domain-containing protein [unclassified Chelatococcus]MBS7743463.1 enoyl-CoA hydratase/isomerase family protein [Chelatococcus sp. HY11]MBX3547097.1 enoyl-CoA hydratase/isomerase family protein [Chelatococcus sp.]CAH1663656.1 Enoyl-CoA hydratase (isoleucine degradation) [Hyphomicrobiales bacterium]CAH1687813.1 Enoyl-CoA hydratase (isoleucine degradation) [Hyphomicrobiales bacterium]
MKHINLTVDNDGVALLTLDHATESTNLVSPEWVAEMNEAIEKIASDDRVRGAVITSVKPMFMAGADLKILTKGFTKAEALEFSLMPTQMHRRLETCGKPFVAAINGLALGGGYELALACHRRIIVDSPETLVGLPEVNVGLLPGSGGTQRLIRMVGVKKGLELLLSGASLAPAEALKAGLVDEIVPADRLLDAASAWILSGPDSVRAWDKKGYPVPEGSGLLNAQMASLFSMQPAAVAAKTLHNYPAPAAILSTVFEGIQLPFDKALSVESKYFAKLLCEVEARNIIRTTFINKGRAEKLVARPEGVPKAKVEKVGVLGAGMMGAGIAFVSALAGCEAVLIDRSQAEADKGKAYSEKLLARDVERGRRSREDADKILARILPTTDFDKLAGVGLVIEAVFEDKAIKADVTRRAQAVTGPDVLFASNTSTLPITNLAEAAVRQENFIGLHFFSPVDRMALVEVILGKKTSKVALAHALDFVAQLRKTPIVVHDSRGFYTSRVFQTFIYEGMAMIGEGIAPALIENAGKFAGMPVGPLAVTDEVSLELPMKIIAQAETELGHAFRRPQGYDVMKKMVEEFKREGRKAGAGFYDYPDGAPKRLWSKLVEHFPQKTSQPDLAELKKRILYIQAIETARCLEEGVLTDPADGDLGSVLGWSYPTYTGGTLSLIDSVGIRDFVAECDRLAELYGDRFRPSEWLRQRAEKNIPFHS